jgi:hypothetical protein
VRDSVEVSARSGTWRLKALLSGARRPWSSCTWVRIASCWLTGSSRCPSVAAGALERAVHRRRARVEQVGHVRRWEAEHVLEQQGRSLRGRRVLEGGDERDLDALSLRNLLVPS